MKKYVCSVCGYVHEGDEPPAQCPQCKAPAEKFTEMSGDREWAAEHVVGVAKGVSEDIVADLRANFEGECSEVGMYLAMARVAHREGYPEIGLYWEKAACRTSGRSRNRLNQEKPGNACRSRMRCNRRKNGSCKTCKSSQSGCNP